MTSSDREEWSGRKLASPDGRPPRDQIPDVPLRTVRVLVTGAGGPAAVAVMKSLAADPSVCLVAADTDPWAAGLYLVAPEARTLRRCARQVPLPEHAAFRDVSMVRYLEERFIELGEVRQVVA